MPSYIIEEIGIEGKEKTNGQWVLHGRVRCLGYGQAGRPGIYRDSGWFCNCSFRIASKKGVHRFWTQCAA